MRIEEAVDRFREAFFLLKQAVEEEVAWAQREGRECPRCHGSGEIYVPADTVYPQPPEWAPCPRCNGWGVLDSNGRGIPPVPPRPTAIKIPF